MKKFFIKAWCLIVNSLLVTIAILWAVILGSFLTVIMFMTTICSDKQWYSLKLRLIMLWAKLAEAITEGITMLQEWDKEHYGI